MRKFLEAIKPDQEEEGRWVTIHGRAIFLPKGGEEQAIRKSFTPKVAGKAYAEHGKSEMKSAKKMGAVGLASLGGGLIIRKLAAKKPLVKAIASGIALGGGLSALLAPSRHKYGEARLIIAKQLQGKKVSAAEKRHLRVMNPSGSLVSELPLHLREKAIKAYARDQFA